MVFEQVVHTLAGDGAGLHDFDISAPFLRQQAVGGEILHGFVHIGAGQIDFVERHDDRHFGRAGMADGFFGLRHDTVVGRHHEHGDIGNVGAASPHFGEGFVAGRIDEGNVAVALFDFVSANVLRDAARFAIDHTGADDAIQERSFTVVDVAQEGNNRRTRHQRGGVVFDLHHAG